MAYLRLISVRSCSLFFLCGALFFLSSHVSAATDFRIAWDPNTETDLDGYGIYIREGKPGPPYEHIEDVFVDELLDRDNPQYTLTDIDDGTYYIVATAFDNQGDESEFSEILGVRVSGSEVTSFDVSDSGGGGGGGGG